jgi:hypothetical protein
MKWLSGYCTKKCPSYTKELGNIRDVPKIREVVRMVSRVTMEIRKGNWNSRVQQCEKETYQSSICHYNKSNTRSAGSRGQLIYCQCTINKG